VRLEEEHICDKGQGWEGKAFTSMNKCNARRVWFLRIPWWLTPVRKAARRQILIKLSEDTGDACMRSVQYAWHRLGKEGHRWEKMESQEEGMPSKESSGLLTKGPIF
jgi:hypothetical protein